MSSYSWIKGNNVYSSGQEKVVTVSDVTNSPHKIALDTSISDSVTRSQLRVHQGRGYNVSKIVSIAGTSSYSILIDLTTTGQNIHCAFHISSSGDARMELFEDCTVSSNGTVFLPISNNRSMSSTEVHKFYHTPTVTGEGTTIGATFVNGGSGPQSSGGQADGLHIGGAEWVLNNSKKYLFKITNITAQTITANPSFTYYQE